MMKGSPPHRLSPAEKKALSYARDCRNAYGENDKASRKAIPARKAGEARKVRRKAVQALKIAERVDEAESAVIESALRQDLERVGGWTKAPDVPLGRMIRASKLCREKRDGRKVRASRAD
jgi:hypothetical protein